MNMWYVYVDKNLIKYSKEKPKTIYIEIEKMPSIPTKKGYVATLRADFKNKKVWYELVEIPKTEEEIIAEHEADIKAELEKLDTVANRAIEDLYIGLQANGITITPYSEIDKVFAKKKSLRAELASLN